MDGKIMRFLQYIQEKLNPSTFRKYVKLWKESGIASRYDEVFGDKDRIYIPFEYKPPKAKYNKTEKWVENALRFYVDGRYEISDYVGGYAQNDKKRVMKIGKLLNNAITKYSKLPPDEKIHKDDDRFNITNGDVLKHLETTLKDFNNDPQRGAGKTKNYLIAISRHAYDIAGMSTHLSKIGGRGWTSCQDLNKKVGVGYQNLNRYVEQDIKAGTIIAYLIKEDDKNIEHPLGRVLLKPFHNPDTGEWILLPSKKYGTCPPKFKTAVGNWANKTFNKGKFGRFGIDPDVYQGRDIKGYKEISQKMSMKEFRQKQAELKVAIIETGQQFVDWFSNDEDWIWIKQQANKGEFEKLIGKRIIGVPYIKKTLILTPDEIKDAYMSHYWTEKDKLQWYHSRLWIDDIVGNLTKENDREIDFAWATISLFTAYDGIKNLPLDIPIEEVLISAEDLLEGSLKYFFYSEMGKKYIATEADKTRILNDFKIFWNKYVKGHR